MRAEFKLVSNEMGWTELKSPCLSEKISILVQLGFLSIIRKCATTASKKRTIIPDHQTTRNCSIVAKFSIVCSSLVVGVHFVLLVMMLNGEMKHCNSKFVGFSSQILHLLSSPITVIQVYRVLKEKNVKFPWILRAWWVCSFLLWVICTWLHTYFRITSHDAQLRVGDYADLVGLLSSAFLLGVSVHGKTGIVVVYQYQYDSISNNNANITDPLLLVHDKHYSQAAGKKRESPYGKATLLQLITFSWLNPLFALGIKKPLEQHEIPDVDIKDSAGFLSPAFDRCLNLVKDKHTPSSNNYPSIYKAIYLFIRKKAAINAALAVVSAGASYVGPYLIDVFVNFLSDKQSRSLESGYLLALTFLCVKMIETIAQRQWIFGAWQLGLRLRAALISHIYNKGLLLSSQSRQSHTSGERINYMSVDIQRITDFIWYLNIVWMLPIQISLAIHVLQTNLGLGSLAALAATSQ